MKNISSYLTFGGNCREAMTFYKECLGGELTFQAIGDSPIANKMPQQMKEYIMHATLVSDNISIMATDMTAEQGLIVGNSLSMMIDCSSEQEARELYYKLSEGGSTTHPLEISFWGALFGDLADKYGINWLIHFDLNNK